MKRDTLSGLYRKVGLSGLPVAAVAVFALTPLPWLGYLLCLAALLYGWRTYRMNGLGVHRVGRMLVVAAVLMEVTRWDAGVPGLALPLTGVLLIALISQEHLLSKALMTGRLRTANLGVRRRGTERVLEPRWAYLVTNALTLLFLACAALGLMVWTLASVTVVVALLYLVATVTAWRDRRSAAHQSDAEVRAAVEAVAPRFMVYFTAPRGSEYQLLMWLPYLDQIGEPYLVVLREAHALPAIARATGQPVVVAPRIANLEHMLVPTIRAVFYVNNGMKNTHCVRFNHLVHIHLNHGDSDKPSSYNPITAMYDRVYVAGQAGIDRYRKHGVNIPASHFRIVGRPQVADVDVCTEPIAGVRNPTVLYAPTWMGNASDVNYSSLMIGERILRSLLARNVTVILRPHPYTDRNPASAKQLARLEQLLAADAARTGRRHRWGVASRVDMSLRDCINAADAMITDVSAVASDWLYSGKPFATTDMHDEGDRFVETFPLSRVSYIIDRRATTLDDVLADLLGADPLADARRQVRAHYLGDFPPDSYLDAFLDEARRCLAGEDDDPERMVPAPRSPQNSPV